MIKIGILAIQGSVIEHKKALKKLDVRVVEVRLPQDLKSLDGLILPGGESTTQSKLMRRFGVFDDIKRLIKNGLPVWGTCAGAILLAKKVTGQNPPPNFGAMNIVAYRNAYGGQLESFEINLAITNDQLPITNLRGIFIRAPKLDKLSDGVEILSEHEGEPVMLREKNMLATSFHPELTDDLSIHEYFLEMCEQS